MKNIIKENDMILRKWESSNKEHGENNFAPDGAMHRVKLGMSGAR